MKKEAFLLEIAENNRGLQHAIVYYFLFVNSDSKSRKEKTQTTPSVGLHVTFPLNQKEENSRSVIAMENAISAEEFNFISHPRKSEGGVSLQSLCQQQNLRDCRK